MSIDLYRPSECVIYTGLASDTKPAVRNGSKLIELDTGKIFLMLGGDWLQVGTISEGGSIRVFL